MKNIRILIVGLGSIGQRHVRMIRKLYPDVVLGALRKRGLANVIHDDLSSTPGDPCSVYGIIEFSDQTSAENFAPNIIFVTNPISHHIDTLKWALELGCHVFVEKPLSHSSEEVEDLIEVASKQKLQVMVGYQLRFHPAFQLMKEIVDSCELGSVVSADLYFGEWLPGMHPYEDYRLSHASRNDQGGGVINCLSHEIDLAQWLFGMPKSVFSLSQRSPSLEADVESVAEILLIYDESPLVRIHLNFLESPVRRYCHIVMENGWIHFDVVQQKVHISDRRLGEKRTEDFGLFQRNQLFLLELTAFFDSIFSGKNNPIPLTDALQVTRLCEAAHRSSQRCLPEKLVKVRGT